MNRNWMTAAMAVAALTLASPATIRAEEAEGEDTTVTQAELPAAVADTVKEFGKGGEFVKAVKADEDGVAVYEVTLKADGRDVEVQTTLGGELNMCEEKVDVDKLPAAAVARIRKAHPGAKLESAELTIRTVYEVGVVDSKGRKHEVLVTPGGQLAPAPEALDEEEGGKEGARGHKSEMHEKSGKAGKAESGEKDEKDENEASEGSPGKSKKD